MNIREAWAIGIQFEAAYHNGLEIRLEAKMAHLGGYYNNPSEDAKTVDMCSRMKGEEWRQEIFRGLNLENLVI